MKAQFVEISEEEYNKPLQWMLTKNSTITNANGIKITLPIASFVTHKIPENCINP